MWETIRGYLTFTRKERLGVLFLLVLISILFVLPYFLRPAIGEPDPAVYEKMKDGIRRFESRQSDSSGSAVEHIRYTDRHTTAGDDNSGSAAGTTPAEMFYFDPNKLNAGEWRRLGLSDRLTNTILHYIDKGGRFRKAEDLKKLYGLASSDYSRLFPFVRIAQAPSDFRSRAGNYTRTDYGPRGIKKADSIFGGSHLPDAPEPLFPRAGKKLEITDINLADSDYWSRLPGIGERLASRIVHFRDRLGGFYRIEQVGETFGLPDSGYQKIKSCLRVTDIALRRIDLNSATREELQAHPYIRWQLARIIIQYRLQHGGFHSVDELLQLAQMDSVNFEKVKPYLMVKP